MSCVAVTIPQSWLLALTLADSQIHITRITIFNESNEGKITLHHYTSLLLRAMRPRDEAPRPD